MQGYPYLSGGMEYEQEFEIDKEFLSNRVCFLDAGINFENIWKFMLMENM